MKTSFKTSVSSFKADLKDYLMSFVFFPCRDQTTDVKFSVIKTHRVLLQGYLKMNWVFV